jgi:hypothetical protein
VILAACNDGIQLFLFNGFTTIAKLEHFKIKSNKGKKEKRVKTKK